MTKTLPSRTKGTGRRIAIPHTRAIVHAVLGGAIDRAGLVPDPIFGIGVPRDVPGVPRELLDPRATWTDPAAYDRQARSLAEMFQANFERYAGQVSDEIRSAAPTC